MNKIYKIFTFFALIATMFTSCSPDEYNLGGIDVKPEDLVEGIAFKIEHDSQNPNIVYLTSLMGSQYTPLWIHPQGNSQANKVSMKIPFAGTYEVQFGVETRGGVVYGNPVKFTVDQMYAGFIEDEMWTKIAGGAGNQKTWYLDLDAEGVSRYFNGPLHFYGTDDSWETVTNGVKLPEGKDSWNWTPDWKGNQWLMDAANFGTMTFDLKNGANVTVEHKTISSRGTEKGLYMLNVEEHTLRMTNASPLHDSNRNAVVLDWGNIKILSLTENTMQLGVLRDAALSGEGAALMVYNYISKDYLDSWTPGEVTEPEPTLPDGWKNDVSQTVSTSIKWVLSPKSPFNWAGLDGTVMNEWNDVTEYPDWTGFNATTPATYSKFSLTLDVDTKTAIYTNLAGIATTGSYALDDKGVYTFTGIKPNFTIGSWVNLDVSAENTWRITKIEKDASGKVTGMWVGVRDAVKPEYMVYLLIPQAS